jgi:hypothetical protein
MSTSPTGHTFGSPYSAQQSGLLTSPSAVGAYDSVQVSTVIEGDLSVAMRGMAVEHEHGLTQHPPATAPPHVSTFSDASRAGNRGSSLAQPQRSAFPAFPQADYSAYYSGPSPYSFDVYGTHDPIYGSPALSTASPALYPGIPAQTIQPHPPPDMRSPQSATFYDYGASGRPPSQYYYPLQPMMYLTSSSPASSHHKRRSLQVSSMSSNLIYFVLTIA